MVSRLSSGFREDCFKFLSDFAKLGSPSFQTFCQEWERANFQFIFCGRNSAVELVEYTSEILYIVKQFFFCCQIPLERIGAFYLLYTLYTKQPMSLFCKIRITLPDWRSMKEFVQTSHNGYEQHQMALILWKLFKADAFQFVQEELEYGFDSFFHKTPYNRFDYNVQESFKPYRHFEKQVQTMHGNGGIIKALEILEMGYNEMKETLDDCESAASDAIVGDKIPQSTLMESLRKDVDSLLTTMGSNSAQVANSASGSSLIAGESEQQAIGCKRNSLRRNAYKRVVKQRRWQIAGHDNSDSSDGMQDSSPPETWNNRSQPDSTEMRGARTIRRKRTCISDDDDDDNV